MRPMHRQARSVVFRWEKSLRRFQSVIISRFGQKPPTNIGESENLMKPRSVTFHYNLKDKAGTPVDSSYDGEPMNYVEGASQIIPGLEYALRDCKTGDKRQITVASKDAYGDRDERLVIDVPFDNLPQGNKTEVGQEFTVELSDDLMRQFRVTSVTETHAKLDGNHPMAGMDLYFDVEVKEAREATQAEIDAAAEEEDEDEHEHHDGCSHGPEGHHSH